MAKEDTMPGPCTPANDVAKAIIESCDENFDANQGDCNKFLKAALADFLAGNYFENLDADQIVGKLKSAAEKWTTSRSIATVIAQAKAGSVVVAGMTSKTLGQSHGHVAVVIGCDGQQSGAKTVPLGYAGSLDNPGARLRGGRLSGTFLATMVQDEHLDYYFKSPDRTPA
jgi:hypothetical protein